MVKKLLILLSLCLSTLVSADAETKLKISGIYSNLTYYEEAGDLGGMELLILPIGNSPGVAYSAFIQIAEGGAPFIFVVPLKVEKDRFEFSLPADSLYGNKLVHGKVSKDEIILYWNKNVVEHLKRGKSYWQ